MNSNRYSSINFIISIFLICSLSSGCAAMWFAGGAATGAAVAKDAEDGKIIDN